MPDKGWVIDASVLGAAFFEETSTVEARTFIGREDALVAPSLLLLEIASIAAKKCWKGLAASAVCERAISQTSGLVALREPTAEMVGAAYELARDHRFSVYDASYLALAASAGLKVVTLDAKLASRAGESGLGDLVALLPDLNPKRS